MAECNIRRFPPEGTRSEWLVVMGCDELQELLELGEDPDLIMAHVYANSSPIGDPDGDE